MQDLLSRVLLLVVLMLGLGVVVSALCADR
jgi:hypothetical protein